jgi:hypothetical protein
MPQAPGMTHNRQEDNLAEVYTTCYVKEELQGNTGEKENLRSNELLGEVAQQDRLQVQQGGSAIEDKEKVKNKACNAQD